MDVSLDITALKGINLQPFARYAFFKGGLDLDAGRDEKDYTNENGNLQTGLRLLFATGKAQWNIVYQFLQTTRTYLDDSLYRDPNAFYIYNHQRYKAHEHFGEAFMVYPFKYIRLLNGRCGSFHNSSHD